MKTYKLMIKEHLQTGLKYLCYTKSEGEKYEKYKGSGKLWKSHLKKHGSEIKTSLVFETSDFSEFKKEAIRLSYEYNVVESEDWANLKIEEGDGGDTVSNKVWITNGSSDKYVNRDQTIPEGWYKGRSTGAFKDRDIQRNLSKRVNYAQRSQSLKIAWENGKYDKRDNTKIGGNLHSEETKKRLSNLAKTREKIMCPHCNKYCAISLAKRWHFEKCKMKK